MYTPVWIRTLPRLKMAENQSARTRQSQNRVRAHVQTTPNPTHPAHSYLHKHHDHQHRSVHLFLFLLHDPNTFDFLFVDPLDRSAASSRSNCSMRVLALASSSRSFPFSSWYDSSVMAEGLIRSSFIKAMWIDLFLSLRILPRSSLLSSGFVSSLASSLGSRSSSDARFMLGLALPSTLNT